VRQVYLALKAKATEEELRALGAVLQVRPEWLSEELGPRWYPNRGIGPIPPTDPVIYRLFEVKGPLAMLFSAYPFPRVCWYTAMP
jgi:cyanate lyase